MSKQKEITHWFCKYLAQFNGNLNYDSLPQYRKDTYKMMVAEDIMPYLHSQGVVIKVERELPLPTWEEVKGTAVEVDCGTWAKMLAMVLTIFKRAEKAGYVATEPLID